MLVFLLLIYEPSSYCNFLGSGKIHKKNFPADSNIISFVEEKIFLGFCLCMFEIKVIVLCRKIIFKYIIQTVGLHN